MAAKRRILFLDHAQLLGGAERSLLYLMRTLDRERFEPLLACPAGCPLAEQARKEGLALVMADMPRLRGQANPALVLARLLRDSLGLARLIRRERADVVHANVMRSALYGALAARLSGRPFIWHVRDIHRERAFVSIVGGLAKRIVVISRAVREALPRRLWLKTSLVPNGIDLAEFCPWVVDGERFREELGIGRGVPLVGNVSWLAPWKGQRLFIQAAALVIRQHPQTRFVIVGDLADPSYAGYGDELRRQAEATLGDRLIFAGPRFDIPQVMAALDLLVHTAQEEPFGRVLIEAMAMETAVVALASGGISEVVSPEETGVLVGSPEGKAVAEAISALLGEGQRREEMGRRGRERVERLFDAAQTARHIEGVYDSLFAAQGA